MANKNVRKIMRQSSGHAPSGMEIGEKYDLCPVCSSGLKHWRTKATPLGDFAIVKCIECGFAFVNPRPTMQYLMDFYSECGHNVGSGRSEAITLDSVIRQEEEFPNSTVDAQRMIKTILKCKVLRNQADVACMRFLDVGCGYGFFSREALEEKRFDVTALELASNERLITEKMTGLKSISVSFEELEESKESYDVILMSQILEHALDVNEWISKAHHLLASGGVLAIALPNFGSIFRFILQENEPYICPPAHLNFFTPKSLSTLLTKHNFTIQEVQWVSRISPHALVKRLPIGKAVAPGIHILSKMALNIFDMLHLGMMINIYAKKES